MTPAPADALRDIEAVNDALRKGYPAKSPPGRNNVKSAERAAADALNINPKTFRDRLARYKREHGIEPDWTLGEGLERDVPEVEPPEARRESRDTAFWQRRAKALEKELASAETALSEISGIRSAHVQPAAWALPAPSAKRNRAVIGLLFSDLHMGEVIAPEEVLRINAFNPEIAERRAKRFFAAACEIGPRWGSDCAVQGAFLALGGDLISGDIHDELKISNALTAHEQVRAAVAVIAGGIRHLKATYRRVHVASVPGNHGRTTLKPTAKLYARLSYDTLIASMVADAFVGDPDVTFQIGAAPDAIVPLLGHTVLLTHGDKMGSGGGMGFLGPMAPIVRGAKKIEAQQARANRRPDLILHGHFHTSGAPGNVLSNGSFPGYSEYGHALRAGLEPPQQWLFLLHERWGVREKAEIKLEDPSPPAKPVVKIPAVMARSA